MYTEKYCEHFFNGIKKTEFRIGSNLIDSEGFLQKVNLKINSKTRIFFIGNGASMSFSNHMALDWSKNGKVMASSLSSSALLTALMNDYSAEEIFSQYLKLSKITKHDIVVAISSSGNSKNILNALEYCKTIGTFTVSFSGLNTGNGSMKLADLSCFVPLKTYGQVECAHQYWLHLWLDNYMGIKDWERSESQNMNQSEFKA
jgi:D-sedoheptulose 7-phosphate isomerase